MSRPKGADHLIVTPGDVSRWGHGDHGDFWNEDSEAAAFRTFIKEPRITDSVDFQKRFCLLAVKLQSIFLVLAFNEDPAGLHHKDLPGLLQRGQKTGRVLLF